MEKRSGKGGDVATVEDNRTKFLQQSVLGISDPENLDESVGEVFETMLGWSCRRDPGARPPEGHAVTAMVGFGGVVSGAFLFCSGAEAAMKIAGRLTGMEFADVDETVLDGIGELCNMLAGCWKGRIPELAAGCGLSVPAVVAGRDYKLRVHEAKFELHHIYCVQDFCFEVTVVCDGLR